MFGLVPDLAENPTRFVLAGLLPGSDINTWVFGRVGTGLQCQLESSYTLASD